MIKFKIGDKVRTPLGIGTICTIDRIAIGVRHKIPQEFFNNCHGYCESNYGYWYSEKDLKLFIKKKINESEMIL